MLLKLPTLKVSIFTLLHFRDGDTKSMICVKTEIKTTQTTNPTMIFVALLLHVFMHCTRFDIYSH